MSLRDLSLLKRGFILLKKYIVFKGYDFETGAIKHTYSFFLFSSNRQSDSNTKNRLINRCGQNAFKQREIKEHSLHRNSIVFSSYSDVLNFNNRLFTLRIPQRVADFSIDNISIHLTP